MTTDPPSAKHPDPTAARPSPTTATGPSENLADALQRESQQLGLGIWPLQPEPGFPAGRSAVSQSPRGTFNVSRSDHSGFYFWFGFPGVSLSDGSTSELGTIARILDAWLTQVLAIDMQARWPLIRLDRFAAARDEGNAAEMAWRMLLNRDRTFRSGDLALAEAAYAEPSLRVLFPFPSHGWFHFIRDTAPPDAEKPPVIVPTTDGWRIYTADIERVLGEADSPADAAALVVAHLPAHTHAPEDRRQ